MKTEKFTELTEGYYKLVGKAKWFSSNDWAWKAYDEFFEKGGLVFIDEIIDGVGFSDEICIITATDYQFFEKVIPEPRVRGDVEVVYSDRIRVGMGRHFNEYLVVACVEGKYYTVQYDGKDLPDGKSILNPQSHHTFKKDEITASTATDIQSAIRNYKEMDIHHVNSFSFLVGYCMACSTNLYDIGVFEL